MGLNIKMYKEASTIIATLDTESSKDGRIYSIGLSFTYQTVEADPTINMPKQRGFINGNRHLLINYERFEQNPMFTNKISWEIDEKFNKITFIFIDMNTFLCFMMGFKFNVVIYTENGAKWDMHQMLQPFQDCEKAYQVLDRYAEYEKDIQKFGKDKQKETMESIKSDWYDDMLEKRYMRNFHNQKVKKAKNGRDTFNKCTKMEDVHYSFWNKLYNNEWAIFMLAPTQIRKLIYKNPLGHTILVKDIKLLFDTRGLKNKGFAVNAMYNLKCDKYHTTCMCKLENENGYQDRYFNNIEELKEDSNEYDYLIRDTEILLLFLRGIAKDKVLRPTEYKETSASTSYYKWTQIYGQGKMDKMIRNGIIGRSWKREKANLYIYKKNLFIKEFPWYTSKSKFVPYDKFYKLVEQKDFPTDWLNDIYKKDYLTIDNSNAMKKYTKDIERYKADNNHWSYIYEHLYDGGMVQSNPRFKNKIVKVVKIDVNSLYPSVMQLLKHIMSPFKDQQVLAPYGRPIDATTYNKLNKKEQAEYKYWYKKLTLTEDLYSSGNIPFICSKSNENSNLWQSKLEATKTIDVDNYTFRAIKLFYKTINNEYMDITEADLKPYLYFKTKPIAEIYGPYVKMFGDKKIKAKEQGDEGGKLIAKLNLNGLYGKNCQKPMRQTKVLLNGKWVIYYTYGKADKYLPIGALITNLARLFMVYFMGRDWDNYGVYMDTDSLAIRSEWRAIKGNEAYLQANCHKTQFEKFEIEKEEADFITVEAKRYCAFTPAIQTKDKKDKWEVTCAGLRQKDPLHGEEDFISFLEGFSNFQNQKTLNLNNTLRLDDVEKIFKPKIKNLEEVVKEATDYMDKHEIRRSPKYRYNEMNKLTYMRPIKLSFNVITRKLKTTKLIKNNTMQLISKYEDMKF